jgi:hypothetical protein
MCLLEVAPASGHIARQAALAGSVLEEPLTLAHARTVDPSMPCRLMEGCYLQQRRRMVQNQHSTLQEAGDSQARAQWRSKHQGEAKPRSTGLMTELCCRRICCRAEGKAQPALQC